MFKTKSHLSLALCLIGVFQKRFNFDKVRTNLISDNVFELDFGEASLELQVLDPVYSEHSEDPKENIKPVYVCIRKLTLSSGYIEICIEYNSRKHTFICDAFQYTV